MAFTDRYQVFRAIVEMDGDEFMTSVWLNPFQIESYFMINRTYKMEDGENMEVAKESAVIVNMKSGDEHVLLCEPDEFFSALNSWAS